VGKPLVVGIIGAGNISRQYLATLSRLPELQLVAIADVDADRARSAAANVTGLEALAVDELLASEAIDVIVNLTVPAAHAEVSLSVLRAGKSVYSEKPLATTAADAREILQEAERLGLRVGCAPDTVLGSGIQSARKVVDDGTLGRVVAASAIMSIPGHELWHPNPEFYYQPGGGPLFDMGPYYLSALVTLLGPIASVDARSSRPKAVRTIAVGERAGTTFPVELETHVTALVEHSSGAISTLTMSFDVVATRSANIEVHGELASMVVPDPNTFDGIPEIMMLGDESWQRAPETSGYVNGGRGIGLLDFADCNGYIRADGHLGFHVLDVMESILESAREGRRHAISSTVERPLPVEHKVLSR
jgi:predicted dehydrogenase